MKRRGCKGCALIEPAPGVWVGGLCPRCTSLRAATGVAAHSEPKPRDPQLEATVTRLRGYLTRIAEQYPDVWKAVDRLRAERGRKVPQWPGWCFMPLAGAYAIASGGADDAPPEQLGAIAAIGALAAWRTTQGVYRFDETVKASLWDTPIEGEIPTEILHRMPEWCVYIETPAGKYLDADSPGFFAYLEHDSSTEREELRLAIDVGDSLTTALPIHLDKGGLVAGLEAARLEAARQAQTFQAGESQQAIMSLPVQMMSEALAPRLNLLLYLCSTNAELLDRKTGRLRPQRPTLSKTKDGMRMFPAEKPVAWDVAYRLGAAIRHAQESPRSKPGDGTHASPRAHVRRAHWHAFWTGPKAKPGIARTEERKLMLHWLPPIPVNVTEETEVVPTAHRVTT